MERLCCPRCGSHRLAWIARGVVSPYRQLRCQDCLVRIRDGRTTVAYAFFLALGLAVCVAVVALFSSTEDKDDALAVSLVGAVGLICAGFSAFELWRPTPRLVQSVGSEAIGTWHVAQGGVKKGPFSLDQLREMVRAGSLKAGDMVLDGAGGAWASAGTIQALFPAPLPTPSTIAG